MKSIKSCQARNLITALHFLLFAREWNDLCAGSRLAIKFLYWNYLQFMSSAHKHTRFMLLQCKHQKQRIIDTERTSKEKNIYTNLTAWCVFNVQYVWRASVLTNTLNKEEFQKLFFRDEKELNLIYTSLSPCFKLYPIK